MKLLVRLLKYIFPYKGNIILIVIFNLFYSLFSVFSMALILPFLSVLFRQTPLILQKPIFTLSLASIKDTYFYYMGQLIVEKGEVSALIFIALTMVLLSFLTNLCRYLGQFFLAPVRVGVLSGLRKDVYKRMIILPLSFYSKRKKGDLMNRMGTDVQEVEWSIISSLQSLCRDPFLMTAYLIALFKTSVFLTIISILLLFIAGYLISILGKVIQKNASQAQYILGKLSAIFEETIGGLRIIKGYNAIDHAHAKFKNETERHFRLSKNVFKINQLGTPIVELLTILTIIALLIIAGNSLLQGNALGAPVIVMFILFFARLLSPAKQLVSVYFTFQRGKPSMQRIYQIIDADEDILEAKEPLPITQVQRSIEYRNVWFSYDKNVSQEMCDVLKDINFTLHKGEKIAFVGASGSGKSTIIDLLPRFYDVPFGDILIDDISIKRFGIDPLRNIFGIVNQDVILFNDTVLNNIAFGNEQATREQVIQAAKVAHAHEFIEQMEFGYDTIIGDRGMKLSGGERQRLSIARAVLKNPQVLILDEATSALDNQSEFLVQQALDAVLQNRTAIIIAHRLSTISHVDKIYFIDDGKIIESGSHTQLMTLQGNYYRYYCSQKFET